MFTDTRNPFKRQFDSLTAKPTARTHNGALTNRTTGDAVLDFFSCVGSARNMNQSVVENLFHKALDAGDQSLAIAALLWARDVREGAGERSVPNNLLYKMLRQKQSVPKENIKVLLQRYVNLGRWDDILPLLYSDYADVVAEMFGDAFKEGNSLAAKWAPREKSKNGHYATILRGHLGLTPRGYRKTIASLSNTVEDKMCEKDWSDIEYSKVPSKAMMKYREAFLRNDGVRYSRYLENVSNGDEKINSSTLAPHEITNLLHFNGPSKTLELQWKALGDSTNIHGNILPMIDVSGSMYTQVGTSNLRCVDVAVGLGLFCAENNSGVLKDHFLTFSENPELVYADPSMALHRRITKTSQANWGFSTDFGKAMLTIAQSMVLASPEDVPDTLLVLSDMEFNETTYGTGTEYRKAVQMFENMGVAIPKIVFWNLDARAGNNPVRECDDGTVLVSGFSPKILESVLSGKVNNPYEAMIETLNRPRYMYW